MNIVYAANDLYAPAAAASVLSVWSNTAYKGSCVFYVLYLQLSDNTLNKFNAMAHHFGLIIKFIKIKNPAIRKLKQTGYLTNEMYLRLTVGKLLPSESRALYLDADTIVTGDICRLYSADLSGNVLGAVKDMPNIDRERELRRAGMNPDTYFNSGVLLFDLRLFRQGWYEKTMAEIRKNSLLYPDQDALNICCGDKVKYIDMKWNFQWGHYLDGFKFLGAEDAEQYKLAMNHFNIIHYTSEKKPWNMLPGAKLSCYFYQYVSQTPFWEDVQNSLLHAVSSRKISANADAIVADQFRQGRLGFSNICAYAKEWAGYKIQRMKKGAGDGHS